MARKKGKGKHSSKSPQADFPIEAFADCHEKIFGMKKSQSGNMKSITENVPEEDDAPDDWEDRDEKEVGDKVLVIKDPTKKTVLWRPKKKDYREIPMDFWHLLARYIPPEKVGTNYWQSHCLAAVTFPGVLQHISLFPEKD